MRVVKTDGRNWLNEENLTHLLRVKVDRPTIDEFHAKHSGKAVTFWYNDWYRKMHPKRKAHKKRFWLLIHASFFV